ncbi:MAG: hypothetical protein H6Q54_1161 [Deltaproteobacteria bacterium]|nr:hypothetical protein [Deltaproteobacteria bacterium]
MRMNICVGYSSQTHSFAQGAPLTRVLHRNILQELTSPPLAHCVGWLKNFCFNKRPGFVASQRFS